VASLVLATQADVDRARRLARSSDRPDVDEVEVRLPWLTNSERAETERTLGRLYGDCACAWGAAAFLVTMVVSLLVIPIPDLWVRLLAALALAAGSSLAAKALGLRWSRWRLVALLDRLHAKPVSAQ
jgi:hypothetical protein